MLQSLSFPFDQVQRILKNNLIIGTRVFVQRHRRLERLEVQEIQRIRKAGEEAPDTCPINLIRQLRQRMGNLKALAVVQLRPDASSSNETDPLIIIR